MRLRAMAKINLGLDVIRKREDGYHEVRMIMQTVRMYDTLEIRKKQAPGISLRSNLPYVPSDERNLVYKAAKILMDEFHVADVPYCVMRGTALAEGIGEKLTPLPPMPECYVLIGKPGINVSTKTAYENLRLDAIQRRPDIDGMIAAIRNQDLRSITEKMENVFEPGIMEKYPVISEIEKFMEERGALKAMMSGSGPTVFGIFEDREKMFAASEALKKSGLAKTVFASRIYNRSE